MLLEEAKGEFLKRTIECKSLKKNIPEYFEALEVAIKSIEAFKEILKIYAYMGTLNRHTLFEAEEIYEMLQECFDENFFQEELEVIFEGAKDGADDDF